MGVQPKGIQGFGGETDAVRLCCAFAVDKVTDDQLDPVLRLALIQNCLVGIRGRAILGIEYVQSSGEVTQGGLGTRMLVMQYEEDVFKKNSEVEHQALLQRVEQELRGQWQFIKTAWSRGTLHHFRLQENRWKLPLSEAFFDKRRWQLLLDDLGKVMGLSAEHQAELLHSGMLRLDKHWVQVYLSPSMLDRVEIRVALERFSARQDPLVWYEAMLAYNASEGESVGCWWGVHPDQNQSIFVVEQSLVKRIKSTVIPLSTQDLLNVIKNVVQGVIRST